MHCNDTTGFADGTAAVENACIGQAVLMSGGRKEYGSAARTAPAAIAVIDQVVFSYIHTKPIAHSLSTYISTELASLTARSSTLQPLTCYCEHLIPLRAITYHPTDMYSYCQI